MLITQRGSNFKSVITRLYRSSEFWGRISKSGWSRSLVFIGTQIYFLHLGPSSKWGLRPTTTPCICTWKLKLSKMNLTKCMDFWCFWQQASVVPYCHPSDEFPVWIRKYYFWFSQMRPKVWKQSSVTPLLNSENSQKWASFQHRLLRKWSWKVHRILIISPRTVLHFLIETDSHEFLHR